MKKYLFMAVAAIAALSSCSSDNDFEQSQTGKQALVFTATMENSEATRATFDNTKKCAAWEAGDQISINGKKYSAQTDGTTTTFEADNEGATGETYNAYFPADLYDGTTATLPTTQTYKEGKFNMPMYASSTTTELEFKNLCAVLAIKISPEGEGKTVKSIKVASDKKMNGTFTVIDNKAVLGTDGTNAVVLKSYDAVTIKADESRVFYIAIPAQEYQYLNIFLSADGKTYTEAMATKKADGLGDIARSKIFNIDYKKNATKMWEGNLFIADCNIGATSLTGLGGLYCWGGITDKDPESAYCPDEKLGDNDTASKLWGSNWRMPTKEELTKLSGLGTWKYSGEYGVNVLECTSKDYPKTIVTLPANGYWFGDDNPEAGLYGNYWSSEPDPMQDGCAWSLRFGSEVNEITPDGSCAYGYSVRAVLEEAPTPSSPTTGKATRNDGDSGRVEVEWVQLWADGPKFAVYNVGAENNKPEDFGGYYCWGNSNDESKTWTGKYYDEFYDNYNYSYAKLTSEYDTATKLWGDNWRMATESEFKALKENCSITDETVGDHTGHRFTGKGNYASNSIFLPDAGDYDKGSFADPGCSMYWTSTGCWGNEKAKYMFFGSLNNGTMAEWNRNCGFSVRAVLNE